MTATADEYRDAARVETVTDGPDGVLSAIDPGQVVVDTGTTTPDVDVYYQERCHERGAGYVDAPSLDYRNDGSTSSS